jgi:predicted PurR-regulated permease PerM
MERRPDDTGEPTITLHGPDGGSQRAFFARTGLLLLAAALLYLVWRIVAPLWQPLLWAVLLGSLLAPFAAHLARRLGGKPRLRAIVTC